MFLSIFTGSSGIIYSSSLQIQPNETHTASIASNLLNRDNHNSVLVKTKQVTTETKLEQVVATTKAKLEEARVATTTKLGQLLAITNGMVVTDIQVKQAVTIINTSVEQATAIINVVNKNAISIIKKVAKEKIAIIKAQQVKFITQFEQALTSYHH